jgi:hypothetical protein
MALDEEKERADAEAKRVKADRLAELRQKRGEAEAAEAQAADDRELAAEELAIVLEQKLGGKRGEAFQVINHRFGVFALRKPDTRAIRNWEQANEKQRMNLEWMIGLMRHYIEPSDKSLTWAQVCADRPGLCWHTGNIFVELMGADQAAIAKK